jgi:hypothetical protein
MGARNASSVLSDKLEQPPEPDVTLRSSYWYKDELPQTGPLQGIL